MFDFLNKLLRDQPKSPLVQYFRRNEVMARIAKIQSLNKLGRKDEAASLLAETEKIVNVGIAQHPKAKEAYFLAAMFYADVENWNKEKEVLEYLVHPGRFQLTEEEALTCNGHLHKLQRERPPKEREGSQAFTTIYSCQNCGRLHNFVSLPCPNCDWSPPSLGEMARSIVLSNTYISLPALLHIARAVTGGRKVGDVVGDLDIAAQKLLATTPGLNATKTTFDILMQCKDKPRTTFGECRACPDCGARISISVAKRCETCDSPVEWPEALKMVVCLDNLLWLVERRVEVPQSREFAEFVCLLVSMANNLLRKQALPPKDHRRYCLELFAKLISISDANRGAIVDTTNPLEMQLYLVRDNQRPDSEQYGGLLIIELKYLAERMAAEASA